MSRFLSGFALVVLLLVTADAQAQSQNFQLFRMDSGLVGAYAPGDLSGYGIGGFVEPKFNATDRIAVGARLEGSVLMGMQIAGSENVAVGMTSQAATLAKGEYFLSTRKVRPFIGLGAGMYTLASSGGGTSGANVSAGRYFGVAPQLGVNLGGFRLAGTYHMIFGDNLVTLSAGNTQKVSRNYASLDIGFQFGGKPRATTATPPPDTPAPDVP